MNMKKGESLLVLVVGITIFSILFIGVFFMYFTTSKQSLLIQKKIKLSEDCAIMHDRLKSDIIGLQKKELVFYEEEDKSEEGNSVTASNEEVKEKNNKKNESAKKDTTSVKKDTTSVKKDNKNPLFVVSKNASINYGFSFLTTVVLEDFVQPQKNIKRVSYIIKKMHEKSDYMMLLRKEDEVKNEIIKDEFFDTGAYEIIATNIKSCDFFYYTIDIKENEKEASAKKENNQSSKKDAMQFSEKKSWDDSMELPLYFGMRGILEEAEYEKTFDFLFPLFEYIKKSTKNNEQETTSSSKNKKQTEVAENNKNEKGKNK